MTTTIQGPDGALIDFPDNTSEAEMNAAMAKAYPTPPVKEAAPVAEPQFQPAPFVREDAPIAAPAPNLAPIGHDQFAQPAAANPFNRQMGADVSYGAPLQAPTPIPDLDRAGELRAATGGPLMDRGAAFLQTHLPEALGGTGQDYSTNLAQNRQDTAAAQQAHPGDAMAGNIAGTLPYMAAPGGILGAAGVGALSGAANSPDWSDTGKTSRDALAGALTGGVTGAVGKAIGAGIGKFAGPVIDASAPTAETIGPMKSAAYQGVKDTGAAYTPQAYSEMVNGIADNAKDLQINPLIHPKASAFIQDMQDRAATAEASGAPVTLTQLDQARQALGRGPAGSSDPGEVFHGMQIRNGIDDFIKNAGPDQMAAGGGQEAADAIQNARDLAQRQFKADELQKNLDHAKLMAAKSGIGGNADNWTRTAMQQSLEGGSRWSPDETAQLTKGVMGSGGQNFLRGVGRLSPTGGALPIMGELSAGAIGAALHGGPGLGVVAALPVAGYAAKTAADRMSKANARNVLATILAGGKAPEANPGPNLTPYTNALAAGLAGHQQ